MNSSNTQLFALDYGVVFTQKDGGWVEDASLDIDPHWLGELRNAGFTPAPTRSRVPSPSTGSEIRVVPLGLKPHVIWSGEAVSGAAADLHEGILPTLPGDPTQFGPGYGGSGWPSWAGHIGQAIAWAGENLVWDGVKWIVKHPEVDV